MGTKAMHSLIGVLQKVDHVRRDLVAVVQEPRDGIGHRLCRSLKHAVTDLRDEEGGGSG